MEWKRIGTLTLCLSLVCCFLVIPAAAVEPGVYTASMVTAYYNPDTGNVDDGGSANAALGEGMCRSATDKTALVEVDGNGDIWVTVRLLLQSNCSNVAFYTRSGYDSYSKASYDITAEDAANDSIDYRFKVSEAGQKLKCTMYVAPMGRDVLWYLYVDTGTMASGSGDFVVSIDTSSLSTEAPAAPVSAPVETPAPVPEPKNTATPAAEPSKAEGPAPELIPEKEIPEEPEDILPDEEAPSPEEISPEEATVPEENAPEDPVEPEEPDTGEPEDITTPEKASGLSGGAIAGIVVVIALIVGAAVCFIKRKK